MSTDKDKKKSPWESPVEKDRQQDRPDSEKEHPPVDAPPERKREKDSNEFRVFR